MPSAIAIVTGANRGIGFETCRQLGRLPEHMRVFLCSRNAEAGEKAARQLSEEGLDVQSRPLDVSSPTSVAAFAAALSASGDHVQILVNNAGVSLDGFSAQVASQTLATNYVGAAWVTDAVVPFMARAGRVVMVSSGMGDLSAFGSALRARFLAETLDRAGLDALMKEFLEDVRRGDHAAKGWPSNAYRVSKAALNALVRAMAPELGVRGIAVNAVCPGWVKTAMGGQSAPRSLEKGASGVVWAATLPSGGPTGGLFRDGKAISW